MDFLSFFYPENQWMSIAFLMMSGGCASILLRAIAHAERGYEDDLGFHFVRIEPPEII